MVRTLLHVMKTETYRLPSYLAIYLMNGDASSLTDEEVAAADRCIKDIGCGSPVSCAPYGFMHGGAHDFREIPLGEDCDEYTFIRR